MGVSDSRDCVKPGAQVFDRRSDSLADQLASTAAADRPGVLRDAIRAEAVGRRPTRDIDALRALERADMRSAVGDILSEFGGVRIRPTSSAQHWRLRV